jgi:hypothetical protein
MSSRGNGGGQSRRREPRYYVDENAEFQFGGQAFACRIVDISPNGAGLHFDPAPSDTPRAGLLISERFGRFRCLIIYTVSDRLGVEFVSLSATARDDLKRRLGDIEVH